MIRTSGVTIAFGSNGRGLSDVTFSVGVGEALALLGSNGAGKTTLLNVLLGHLVPERGSVSIDGIDPFISPLLARTRLAYVPEVATLYGRMSGIDNLRFFDSLLGRERPENEYVGALDRCGIAKEASSRPVATYSKGMRQKVALTIALLKDAPALLMDEPFSGLDPGSREELSAALHELQGSGVAVLLTSHDLFGAMESATRIAVLASGRLVVHEEVAAFRKRDVKELYGALSAMRS